MTTATKRKAYVREVKANWWTKLGLVLLYGVIALGNGTFDTNFVDFLKNPIVIILNLVSLAAMLLHAATLFIMTPQVLGIMVKGEKLPVATGAKIMWGITAVISIIVLALAL